MKEVVKIKDLKKHFGKVKAVDGVSFDVKKGEILGFLGPNGAGKTTTIRCMLDFIRPNSGSVEIFGKDVLTNTTNLKERIGYLASGPRLYESWTGRRHIDLIKEIRDIIKDPKELISRLNFDPNLKVANLSTGNKQKLALILSLMSDPDLMIMDEPTLGLDPILQNAIYEILEELKEEKKTIFLSSHNLHEVEKICDRVVIIKQGKIAAIEEVSEIKKKHIYTVRIDFKKDFKPTNYSNLKNVKVEKKYDHRMNLAVKGDINPLLKVLAKEKIKDVEINHADLEKIFLEFYK